MDHLLGPTAGLHEIKPGFEYRLPRLEMSKLTFAVEVSPDRCDVVLAEVLRYVVSLVLAESRPENPWEGTSLL